MSCERDSRTLRRFIVNATIDGRLNSNITITSGSSFNRRDDIKIIPEGKLEDAIESLRDKSSEKKITANFREFFTWNTRSKLFEEMAGEPRSLPVRELPTIVLSIALCLAVEIAVVDAHGQNKHLSRGRECKNRVRHERYCE